MTISVATSAFRKAVGIAGRATDRRNTMPVLGAIHCRANGAFEATGTDLDITLSARVPREGKSNAEFLIQDHRTTGAALKAAGGDDVAITVSGKDVAFATGAMLIGQAGGCAVDDFPMPTEIAEETFSADLSPEFIAALVRVTATTPTQETRYYLNGVYFEHLDGWNYRVVSTDGYRMSFVEVPIPGAAGKLNGVIIPRRAVSLLTSLAAKSDTIKLRMGSGKRRNVVDSTAPADFDAARMEAHFQSSGADVSMSCKLIDGTFPDYRRVVPTTGAHQALFDAGELRRAVSAVAAGKRRIPLIKIALDDGGALLSSHYWDAGLTTKIRIACKHNGAFEVGYNGHYLVEMIDAAGAGEISLAFDDQSAPAMIRNTADSAWAGILMPVRC